MKYVKMLGLAAVAAMALMAFLGASSASATVLCKTAETSGCAASGWDYSAGTLIKTSLEAETTATLKTTGGAIEDTCTGSTVEGNSANTGGANETVHGEVETAKLTFTGCSQTTTVLEGGELEIHHIANTDNGTLTAKRFRVRINLGVNCTYGAGNGTDLGTLTGGSMATMDINAVVNLQEGGFLCPSTALWQASYTVTSPEPLYISAS
jgi:hypothetical protein